MARYEGPGDTRSAWEDEKRSNSWFKPMKFLGCCLGVLFFVAFLGVVGAMLFGSRPDPMDAYIVKADGTQTCVPLRYEGRAVISIVQI